MQTTFIRALLFGALVVLAGSAMAEVRIGVIDQERVLFGSDAAASVSRQLQQEFGSQQMQIQELERDITALRDRGETDAALMSEDELSSLNNEIQSKLQEREQLVRQLQQAQQQSQQAFLEEYEAQVTGILEAIVQERDLDILISSDEVLFSRSDMDITSEALERFNAAYAEGQ